MLHRHCPLLIPLPAAAGNKKAVVNVHNKDDCFLEWALQSALFQAGYHIDRPSRHPIDDGLDFRAIESTRLLLRFNR